MTWRETLDRLPDAVPPSEIEAAIGELERAKVGLFARLLRDGAGEPRAPERPEPGPDRLLRAEEAAQRLGCSPRWVYDNARELPFTRRIGRRAVRFSERGLERYIAGRR